MAGNSTMRNRGIVAMLAALWLCCLAGVASAATVTDESGGTGNGSFRQVVGSVGSGETITFAEAVRKILLSGTAQSAAEELTITGRTGTFPAELDALLGQYGIDVSSGTADFSGLTNGIDQQALVNALDRLTLPGVVLDGGGAHRLLDLAATTGNATSLTGLTLQNAHQNYTSPDIDNSLGGGAANTSVEPSNAQAQGGGVRLAGPENIANSALIDNKLTITAGNATAGSGGADAWADASANASGGGAFLAAGDITSSLVQGNTAYAYSGSAKGGDDATVADAHAYADASGGGAFLLDGNITSSLVQGNTAYANGNNANGGDSASSATADASADASGGGAFLLGGNITSSLIQGNAAYAYGGCAKGGNNTTVTFAFAYATANARVSGGGAYLVAGDITSSLVQGNTAYAHGGSAKGGDNVTATVANASANATATANAYGGGAYLTDGGITSSFFTNNTVTAVGGSMAQGGSNASGTATYTWANADAYAFGGGAFLEGNTVAIENSVFTGNTATAEATGTVIQPDANEPRSPQVLAAGGAVFVSNDDPFGGGPKLFTLSATTDGQTIIAGNSANGEASGIHFGRVGFFNDNTGYFRDSVASTTFTLEANGEVLMYDPVSVEAYRDSVTGAAFAMDIDVGTDGRFVWGGNNVLDANGGSTVNFNTGVTTLTADFTLATSDRSATGLDGYRTGSATDAYARSTTTNTNGTGNDNDLIVNLDSGTTLMLDAVHSSTLAVFDFTRSSSANQNNIFNTNGSDIGLDTSRSLLSFTDKRFLLADGVGNTDRDDAAGNIAGLTGSDYAVTGFDSSEANRLWMTASYDSPYQSTIDAWENLGNAAPALEQMLANRVLVSDALAITMKNNLNVATADQALDSAVATLSTTGMVAGNALRLAFPTLREDEAASASGTGYMSLAPARRTGLRLWGGYVGAFERMDAHGRHRGYRQTTNGFLTGIGYDFTNGSVGGYIGYTDSRLRMKGGANGRVDADGYHLGLVGTVNPFRELSALTLSGDFGFAYYDASSRRDDGTGRVSGDFAQRAWTASAAASYAVPLGRALATPYASFRWTGIDQNSLHERGGLTATRVDKASADSFASELGFRLSGDWRMGCVTVSPNAHAAWRHEFGDRDVSAAASYNGLPGMAYHLSSTARDRDAAVLGAGLSARRELSSGRSVGANLGYSATVGRHNVEHSLSAMLELSFY